MGDQKVKNHQKREGNTKKNWKQKCFFREKRLFLKPKERGGKDLLVEEKPTRTEMKAQLEGTMEEEEYAATGGRWLSRKRDSKFGKKRGGCRSSKHFGKKRWFPYFRGKLGKKRRTGGGIFRKFSKRKIGSEVAREGGRVTKPLCEKIRKIIPYEKGSWKKTGDCRKGRERPMWEKKLRGQPGVFPT